MNELQKRARPILFQAHFYQGDFNPDSIGQKVHPKKGPKKIFGPFFNAIELAPCIPWKAKLR